jgi:o-succinylbenzoate synthase
MSILRVRVASYALPFLDRWPVAGGRLAERSGFLLELTDDEGLVGLGDAAPWPGFGSETPGSAGLALRGAARKLLGLENHAFQGAIAQLTRLAPVAAAPAARHAIDLALHDLLAQRAGLPIAGLLGGVAALARVPANATIPRVGAERTAELAAAAISRGARTIKLKVGGAPLQEDVARVRALREAAGREIRIRIDGNQEWSVEEAIEALRALAPFDIEYAEQPVAAEALADLARVRREAGVPIAADESVHDLGSARHVLEAEAADVLIVKPMVLGGLEASRVILVEARARGVGVVVTSLLESAVGRVGALHLAASLGPLAHAHGVATGSLLARDLAQGPEFEGGVVAVPSSPGLGVAVEDPDVWRDAFVVEAE